MVVVIDADGKVSGYVRGVSYEEEDIRHALTAAWAGDSLVKKYRFWIAGIAATCALLTAIVVVITGQRRVRSQPA